MDNILAIVTLAGLVILGIGYLIVIVAGFKHHFVTGLIAMIPGVNILVIPSTWDKASSGFILGIVGLVIAAGGWFGGNGQIYMPNALVGKNEQAAVVQAGSVQSDAAKQDPQQTSATGEQPAETDSAVAEVTQPSSPLIAIGSQKTEGLIMPLPNKPLYMLTYQQIENSELSGLLGQYIRITDSSRQATEGKLLNIEADQLLLQKQEGSESIALSDIAQLEKLVKVAQ
jgi:hypothetical protein